MDGRGDGTPRRFRLLFVCTGNICRSPFARFHTRLLLEMRLGPRWASWFDVASGGTGAVVGAEMHPLSRAQLGPLATHPDVAAFRARQLPARDVEMADLVLTVSRSHRSAVLELEPRALRSTFTLPEFARLLEGVDHPALPADPRERAHALVAAALAERGQGAPVDPEDDAIPDPVQGTVADHAETARRIHAAVRPLVDAIGAAVPWPARPGPPRRPGPPPGVRPGPGPRPPFGVAVPPGPYPPGQHPPGQHPPGHYPPGQHPPGHYPPGAAPRGPLPPGVVPAGNVPGAGAPGPVPPGPLPPGQVPPDPVPPGPVPPGPVAPGSRPGVSGGAVPPGEVVPSGDAAGGPPRSPVVPPGAQVPRPTEPADPLSPATPLSVLGEVDPGPAGPDPEDEHDDQEAPAVLADHEARSRRSRAGEDAPEDETARAHSTPRAGR